VNKIGDNLHNYADGVKAGRVAALEKAGREAVSEGVAGRWSGDARRAYRGLDVPL